MNREQLQDLRQELIPMEGTAIVYMLFVEERKHIIETVTRSDPKGTDFSTMIRKVGTNPNQAVVVSSAIQDIIPGDVIYIDHRYYPYPMIHYGVIYHRIRLTDILCKVAVTREELEHRLSLKSGIGRTWSDEPIELTRKDVLT